MSQKTNRDYSWNSAGNTIHLTRVLCAIFASKKLFKAVDKCGPRDRNINYRIPVVGTNFHTEANEPFGGSFPNDKKSYQGKDFIALNRKPMKIILEACLSGKKSHIEDAIAQLQLALDAKSSSKKKKVAETPSPKKEKETEELTLSNE